MYQASASFQQTCLQQMQTLNATVGEACHEVVGQALEKPRTWREYFAKGAQVVKRGMESIDEMLSTRGWRQSGSNGAKLLYDEVARNEAKLMYDEVVDSIEEEPESTEAERVKPGPVGPRIGRFWRCTQETSYSGRPRPPIDYVCWATFGEHRPKLEDRKGFDEVDFHDIEVDQECIRMQGDAGVMYGGMSSYDMPGTIAYENVSTLSCERYGHYLGEVLGGFNGSDESLDSDMLAFYRAQETRSLFHELQEPLQWEYLSWPRLVWNTTGWDVEDMRVVEGLAATLIVTMVGYMMRRRKTAC